MQKPHCQATETLREELLRRARTRTFTDLEKGAVNFHEDSQSQEMSFGARQLLGRWGAYVPSLPLFRQSEGNPKSRTRGHANVTVEKIAASPNSGRDKFAKSYTKTNTLLHNPSQPRPSSSIYSASPLVPLQQKFAPQRPPQGAPPAVPRVPPPVRTRLMSISDSKQGDLAQSAAGGKRRRTRERHHQKGHRVTRRRQRTHFLFCFPWIKSRRARSLLAQCFVTGLFSLCVLATYLGLTITKVVQNKFAAILLIIFCVISFALFTFAFLRLCLLALRDPRRRQQSPTLRATSPAGFAAPNRLSQVKKFEDEANMIGVAISGGPIPPAYGHWRESVRVHPDQVSWQDIEGRQHSGRLSPRPPSYDSGDDDHSFVIDGLRGSVAVERHHCATSQRFRAGTGTSEILGGMVKSRE